MRGSVRYRGKNYNALFNFDGVDVLRIRLHMDIKHQRSVLGRIRAGNSFTRLIEDKCNLTEYAVHHSHVMADENKRMCTDWAYYDERAYKAACRRIMEAYKGVAMVHTRKDGE